MSENKVKWHPYPEEKPKYKKNYLVTIYCLDDEYDEDDAYLTTAIFYWFGDCFFDPFHPCWAVVAWAELPKPYKPESKE